MTPKPKRDLCCKYIQLVLLLDMFVFLVVSSTRFCYVGINANSKDALLNQSCVTNKTHVAQSLLATEYRLDIENKQKSYNSSLGSKGSAVEYCYIFRHISKETLQFDVIENVHSRFSCDFEGVCKGKETNKIIDKVGLRSEVGELYCCRNDNCNSLDKMPRTPAYNQICYHGESNGSNVNFESCGHPDTYCLTRTIFTKDEQVEMYSCDNRRSCDKLDQHGAYNFCHKTNNGNLTEQLCCCVANKCNRPSDPSLVSGAEKIHVDSVVSSTDTWRHIIHPIANPNAKDKQTSLVKGLVASIVVVALVGVIVLLVLAYRRRKRRDGGIHSDPNVIMQYERLSCSDASLEGSVSV